MNKMTIIQLLNKIANGENISNNHMKYFNRQDRGYDICSICLANLTYKLDNDIVELNDEVEILEEEKKIPENLGYQDNADGTFYLNRKKYNSEPIKILSKKINDIIDYLDYLKSKGE